MKKIVIGVNLFEPNERQELCIQSLKRLKQKFNIELVNLQFVDGTDLYEDERIPTLRCLKKKSKDYVGTKNRPIVKEFFDVLSELDCEYFCFTNNDIIISDRYITRIIENDYDCLPACRLAIEPIESLTDEIKASHYQCVGFDVFAVKPCWWGDNRDLFLDFIAGHPQWDVDYATIMRVEGDTFFVNDWPASIFHVIHEAPWTTKEKNSLETLWNTNLHFKKNAKYSTIWWKYVYKVPLSRKDKNYWYPLENEKQLEESFFKK